MAAGGAVDTCFPPCCRFPPFTNQPLMRSLAPQKLVFCKGLHFRAKIKSLSEMRPKNSHFCVHVYIIKRAERGRRRKFNYLKNTRFIYLLRFVVHTSVVWSLK